MDQDLAAGSTSVEAQQLLLAAQREAQNRYGFASLRTYQHQVLQHVFAQRDALAVLPTGAGKSLCYGLPSTLRPGLTVVISPLIALIRDQVRSLRDHDIAAAAIDSLQTREEKQAVRVAAEADELDLLFVSPERMARPAFRNWLAQIPLQLIAIDEAHCVSQWGNDFRPDYRMLGTYLNDLPPTQKLAVTATATPKVRANIIELLGLENPGVVVAPFQRDNLEIKVFQCAKVADQLGTILQGVLAHSGQGIIYVPTRKSAQEIHRMLTNAKVHAGVYHAGLSSQMRAQTHQDFSAGKVRVVVATHAFGMGINKSDLRFVHHAGLPASLEHYVQEIGRAGRDGGAANCWLVYSRRDYHIRKFMIDKSLPDPEILRSVYESLGEAVKGPHGASEDRLIQQAVLATKAEHDVVSQCLEFLCREGLFLRLRGQSAHDYSEEYLIGEGAAAPVAEEILAEYPARREEAFAKLDAIRGYADAKSNRHAVLDQYFGSAEQEASP